MLYDNSQHTQPLQFSIGYFVWLVWSIDWLINWLIVIQESKVQRKHSSNAEYQDNLRNCFGPMFFQTLFLLSTLSYFSWKWTNIWKTLKILTKKNILTEHSTQTLKKSRKLEDRLESIFATCSNLLSTKSRWLAAANPAVIAQPYKQVNTLLNDPEMDTEILDSIPIGAVSRSCVLYSLSSFWSAKLSFWWQLFAALVQNIILLLFPRMSDWVDHLLDFLTYLPLFRRMSGSVDLKHFFCISLIYQFARFSYLPTTFS